MRRVRALGRSAALVLALALAAPCAALAQGDAGAPSGAAAPPAGNASAPPKASELVRAVPAAPLTLQAGGAGQARFTFRVPAPWHVNAHKPNEDFLVPTVLTLTPAAGLTAGTPSYPAPIQAKLSFSDTPLAVYEGDFTVAVPIAAGLAATPGAHTLHGTLRFQSCDDQVCLPPATIPVALQVQVVANVTGKIVVVPGSPPPAGTQSPPHAGLPITLGSDTSRVWPGEWLTDSGAAGQGTSAPTGSSRGGASSSGGPAGANLVSNWFEQRGSLLAFVLIFLMGLALNLTPCVYPMMGVTISLFGGGMAGAPGVGAGAAFGGARVGAASGLKALPRALVYVLGIALMYSTLGVIAALTGGLFGGWLANPWVLGAIGALLLAMALSMFGVYEIQAPSALLSKLGGAAGASLFGTFLAGLMVGVFAAPCIGPPIIALLAHVGAKHDPVFGFWAFFVLSLGLGLPYLVLGVSTGLLSRLPRSGSWMDWVKHLFGVILLGVAAFYLCLAIAPSKLSWVVPMALGVGGLYLGFLEPTGRDRPGFRRFKWAVGVAGIAAAAIVAFETPAPAVAWEEFGEEALAAARAQGKPVVLDFSASWCVPCHELDDKTFSDAAVAKALLPFVKLKVDLTRFDSPASLALRKRYDIQGVPTIVFLAADGSEVTEARSVGFVPPASFQKQIELAQGGPVSARP